MLIKIMRMTLPMVCRGFFDSLETFISNFMDLICFGFHTVHDNLNKKVQEIFTYEKYI